MPRRLKWLFIRLKDLRHFPAGRRRERSRGVRGGSEVGKTNLREKCGFPVHIDATLPQKDTRSECRRSGRNILQTVRGGSRHETPGGRAAVVLPTSWRRPATAGYPERGVGSARWVSRRTRRRLNHTHIPARVRSSSGPSSFGVAERAMRNPRGGGPISTIRLTPARRPAALPGLRCGGDPCRSSRPAPSARTPPATPRSPRRAAPGPPHRGDPGPPAPRATSSRRSP